MALSSEQKSSRLFKKALGAGETLISRQFFEEPRLGGSTVLPEQIWSEASTIPLTAPNLSDNGEDGVVKYLELLELTHVAGSQDLSYFSSDLIDAIPFNFGDGTYNYGLFKNNGTTVINFGEGDWLLDTSAGLLTFYGSLPSGVNAANPPKVSFYKYIGTKGVSSPGRGLEDGGSGELDVNVDSDSLEINYQNEVSLKQVIQGERLFTGNYGINIQNDDGLLVSNSLNVGYGTASAGTASTGYGNITGGGRYSFVYSKGSIVYGDHHRSQAETNVFVFGDGNRTVTNYETMLGTWGTEATSTTSHFGIAGKPKYAGSERLVNVGSGENTGSGSSPDFRKDAWSLYRNGAQKLESRPLADITNAVDGFFALDENSKPNFFYNSKWNGVAQVTDPIYQTESPTSSHSGTASLTSIELSQTPSITSTIEVFVNGQRQRLGETNTSDCWFGDTSTAKTFDSLSTSDTFVWNASSAGFTLDTSDIVDIIYTSVV
jgi:hypothetical protein